MIYLFKTSVDSLEQANQLRPHLDENIPHTKWNFDLDDCDRILRIDSDENIAAATIKLLTNHKFSCEELE